MAKPKKWAAFKGVLPNYQGEPERIQIIDEVKKQLTEEDFSNTEIAKQYQTFYEKKEELKEQLKAIEIQLEARNSLLVERFQNSGVSSMKLDTGVSFFTKDDVYPKLVDKEKMNQWFIDNGLDELRSVHPSTLTAITKERLENAENPPDGVELFMKSTIVMRRS